MGCGSSSSKNASAPGTPKMSPEALSYSVMCPPKGKPGQTIVAHINGKDMAVVIPSGATPGQVFRFYPGQQNKQSNNSTPSSPSKNKSKSKQNPMEAQFERDNSIIRDSFFEVDGVGGDDEDFDLPRGATIGSSIDSTRETVIPPQPAAAAATSSSPPTRPQSEKVASSPPAAAAAPAPSVRRSAPASTSSSAAPSTKVQSPPAATAVPTPPTTASAAPITSAAPGSIVQVTVPAGVQPNEEFHVMVNG